MRIWIDFTNSPHVNFFQHIIEDIKSTNEIIITCRSLANTTELLDLCGYKYSVVGKHYGKNKLRKAFGFIIRVLQLVLYLRKKDIQAAISHSSFYSPIVSKLLGIRCIYINDNEFAKGNEISFLFANTIMIPEYLNVDKVVKQGAKKSKIKVYPGLKEGVYLWKKFKKNKTTKIVNTIYIRPEPWTAQYYKGKNNFIDKLIYDLKDKCQIVILPRGKIQEEYYSKDKFSNIKIPDKSLDLSDILNDCDLFIGAGGTMSREAAICGIPTISIYQDELLDVDKYLIDKGLMIHKKDLHAEFVIEYLNNRNLNEPSLELLEKGKEAFKKIRNELLEE